MIPFYNNVLIRENIAEGWYHAVIMKCEDNLRYHLDELFRDQLYRELQSDPFEL